MTRPLVPHDSTAYAQLFAPLAAALLVQPPSISAVLLSVAVLATFFGSEALLVLRGGRGLRRRELDGERASKRVYLLGMLVLVTSVLGLVLAPIAALQLAALVAVPATISLVLATNERIHTRAGELLVAVTLTGVAAPIAAASGVPIDVALLLWLAWSIGFATMVLAIHGVIRRRRDPELDVRRDLHVAAAGVLGAFAISNTTAAIAVPLAVSAAVITGVQPRAQRLTLASVALAIAATLSALVEVAVLR